ncbi:MAG TPA: PEP-utilizing enzyme, partial [Acidimicrobiia bacterium]|nr:PEP-utilizing enzyme [Acidimicrobiia bacterium]
MGSQQTPSPRHKWGGEHATPSVKAFHTSIRARMQEKFEQSGKRWEDVVFDPTFALTKADCAAVEAELLATGYRFDHSAQISVVESPEKYKAAPEPADAVDLGEAGEGATGGGEAVVGVGDNALPLDHDVEGTIRFVDTIEKVMDMMGDGVPPETIAVIEDAGGTLTAPILEGFTGVLCKGGTIKSHLAVLSREFRIPCLMAVDVAGIADGDRVRMESSKPPPDTSAEAAKTSQTDRARIWK